MPSFPKRPTFWMVSSTPQFTMPSLTPERLNMQERIEFIKALNKTGIFLLKGSISAVSAQPKCSEATVYRYLSQINQVKL